MEKKMQLRLTGLAAIATASLVSAGPGLAAVVEGLLTLIVAGS